MQQQNGVYFTSQPTVSDIKAHKTATITKNNLVEMTIYLAIRIYSSQSLCLRTLRLNKRNIIFEEWQ